MTAEALTCYCAPLYQPPGEVTAVSVYIEGSRSNAASSTGWDASSSLVARSLSEVAPTSGDIFIHLALVVQRVDNAIHRINHYPVDSLVCFLNTYPLDSDLSGG